MGNRLGQVLLSVALPLTLLLAHVTAQTTESEVPRAWDGHPDLNGVWQAIGTAHWDIQDHPAGAGHPDMGAIGAIPPGQGALVRRGWSRDSVMPGIEVLVEGYQAIDGGFRANGRDVTFPDGRRLFAGSSGTCAPWDGRDPTESAPR